MTKHIIKTKQDTQKLAKQLALKSKKGDIFALQGTLGVGKTFFVSQFINALLKKQNQKPEQVTSPTFNILKIYETKEFPIYHFDLYRLKKSEELYELGIEQAFENGITLIEWPELAQDLLPTNYIKLKFSFGKNEEERIIEII